MKKEAEERTLRQKAIQAKRIEDMVREEKEKQAQEERDKQKAVKQRQYESLIKLQAVKWNSKNRQKKSEKTRWRPETDSWRRWQ